MRKQARETAFKVIYKSLFLENDYSSSEILEEDNILNQEDVDFVNTIVELYQQNVADINNSINCRLRGYTPERVYRIDRAILSLAITEIRYYKQTPIKVVINEAIEMAKKYSTEKSYSFVNGLLKSLIEGENVI